MKKLIVIFIALITMAAAFAAPLPPKTRQLIESELPKLEQDLEHNKEVLDNSRLQAEILEGILSRLDKKHELTRPGRKFLKALTKYNEWLAEYIAASEKLHEIYRRMLETGSIDRSLYGVDFDNIAGRGDAVENNYDKAQAEYNAAVRAYNLKRGM